MKRWSIVAILALLVANLFVGAPSPVVARQDAAAAVALIGPDGAEQATMTVDGLLEPFEDFDSGSEPERGMHYVLATITVENTGTADFIIDTYAFRLVDSDGFVASTTWVYRDDRDYAPDLDSTPIEPGSSVTGSVFFAVYDGATANVIAYNGPYTRWVILAEQLDGHPAVGDPVDAYSSDGNAVGTVTVDEFMPEVTGVYPGYEAQRGFRYMQIVVTIENTSRRPIDMSPSYFSLIDSEGYLAPASSIYFIEDPDLAELGYDQVPGNDRVTGRVAFQVYVGAEPVRVVYQPTYEQFFTVALLDDTAVGPVAPEGAPDGGGSSVVVDPACADVQGWYDRTQGRFATWSDNLDAVDMPDDPKDADPDAVRGAADMTRAVIDDMEADAAPEIAADYEAAVIAFLDATADYLDDMADAIANGDDLDAVTADYEPVVAGILDTITDEEDALVTACDIDI
jgi:hypothetical protein